MVTIPPFNTYLGIHVDRMEAGEAVCTIELGPHHLNGRGVAHGGVLSSLLDTALGAAVIAAIPKEWWCATTSLSVQYLDGAREGTLTATARVLRRGGRSAFAGGEVVDASGRLLATAQGSWHLWPYKPDAERPAAGPWVVVRGSGRRLPVGKILAVGRNYADHVAEMGNAASSPPVLFLKPSSAIVHDGATVSLPVGVGSVHHEVELVVVIGKAGRAIPDGEAMDHVLGYAVGLDLTLRDLQAEAKRKGEPWSIAKGFDGSAPVSIVAPKDEVGDPHALELALAVNGERRQGASTAMMLHRVPALVAFASRFMTLEPGDLIYTGTPAGVGPVVSGSTLTASLERVGSVTVRVV